MTYSACDLQTHVHQQLRSLGITIRGDDANGWEWTLGPGPNDETSAEWFDTAAEASAAALTHVVGCIEDLLNAAQGVLDTWEKGDLAAAVRQLRESVGSLRPGGRACQTGAAALA